MVATPSVGAAAAHLVGEREQEAEAGGGERVAERDRAAVGVHARGVDAERARWRRAATPANASLISHRSMSAGVRPCAVEQALRAASAGRRWSVESGPATTARPTTSASGS